jgi:hypothetical protein
MVDLECEPGCSEGGESFSARKQLRGEKPFEQPIESVLAYQYGVNKIRGGVACRQVIP